MIDPKKLDGLTTFSAGYLKRWLEGNLYDRIFKTELGEKLKSLDKKARYGIEFGLNLLTAFFDQKLADDTALKKFVKEVGIDVGPEISKRLINNTKEQLINNATTQEEKELVNVLLELEDQTLIDLLNWLYDIEATERASVLKQLSRLSLDEVMRFAKLPNEERKKLLDLFKPPPYEKLMDKATSELKSFNEQWEKWLEEKRKARR
ncbi:MAG: hypothetical protein DDT18_02001 [Actinobacteria bacterium]|nr:hypothetical protein [Actinomycetota bacterium]